jgi:ribonuclease BN (tRNA processing enzyme)
MKLVVIGSGTSVPHPERSSSGYWIETERGSLMLDFSASAIHRIAREGLDWTKLDAIWISHFHLDHMGGLAPFLFGTKWAPEMQNRTKPMRIFGAKGLRRILEIYDGAYNFGFLEQPFPLEITEVEPLEKFQILADLEAVSFDTPHTPESRAIHLKDEYDKTLVFTADTGFTKVLGTFARNVDLFVMECSFVKNKPVESHLELAEAMYLTRYSRAKKVVLTHLYPEWDEVNFEEEIEKFSPGCEIIEAQDGLRINI